MAEIILDYSANTFRNDKTLIKRAIDEIKTVDTGKHSIVFKTQLFVKCGDNIPCTHESFEYMYEYGNSQGYKVTSSVFDKESLDYLLKFDVPFIKIANRPDLYWLAGEIPRKFPIYMSASHPYGNLGKDKTLGCISKYPAVIEDYENIGIGGFDGISDHTIDWELFNKYRPVIYECHYCLTDSTGLDAGIFARRIDQLKEIL